MEYIAESKNVKVSPRKVRLVAEGVKKLSVANALLQLQLLHKRAATPVRKTLASAVANAVHNHHAVQENLIIQNLLVNEGISYKRYHFASRGRIKPYKKRTSHIRVVLADKVQKTEAPAQIASLPATTEKQVKKASLRTKKGDK